MTGAPVVGSGESRVRRRGLAGKQLDAEPADVGLAVEAAVALLLARVALRTVSLRTVADATGALYAAANGPGPGRGATVEDVPSRLEWAVDAASGQLGGACLVRSVAPKALLARRGVASGSGSP